MVNKSKEISADKHMSLKRLDKAVGNHITFLPTDKSVLVTGLSNGSGKLPGAMTGDSACQTFGINAEASAPGRSIE